MTRRKNRLTAQMDTSNHKSFLTGDWGLSKYANTITMRKIINVLSDEAIGNGNWLGLVELRNLGINPNQLSSGVKFLVDLGIVEGRASGGRRGTSDYRMKPVSQRQQEEAEERFINPIPLDFSRKETKETTKMKIQINTDEMYEIKIPDTTNSAGLRKVIFKLTGILKMIKASGTDDEDEFVANNETSSGSLKEKREYNKEGWVKLRTDRELMVSVLKAYYTQTKEQYDKIVLDNNLSMLSDRTVMCSSGIKALIEFHKILPNEVGIESFGQQKKRGRPVRVVSEVKND